MSANLFNNSVQLLNLLQIFQAFNGQTLNLLIRRVGAERNEDLNIVLCYVACCLVASCKVACCCHQFCQNHFAELEELCCFKKQIAEIGMLLYHLIIVLYTKFKQQFHFQNLNDSDTLTLSSLNKIRTILAELAMISSSLSN